MKTENLMFGHLGNGVTVCDRNRTFNNDYLIVAHINFNREVCYYIYDLTEESKREIEDFAKAGNMSVSASQPYSFALAPLTIEVKGIIHK